MTALTILNTDVINVHLVEDCQELLKDFYFLESCGNTFLAQRENDTAFKVYVTWSSTESVPTFNEKLDALNDSAWYSIHGGEVDTLGELWELLCEAEDIFLTDNQ